MQATGTLMVGESTTALAYRKNRWGMSPFQIKIILAISMLAVGIPVGTWVSGSWSDAASSVEFAIVGLIIGTFIVQRTAAAAQRRALALRGQDHELVLTVTLSPKGISYDLGDLTMAARWPAVTDLYSTRKYWVFLIQSGAMVLPRRFFPTREAEREFIAEATSQMMDAARIRSPDAVRFAGA